MIELKKQLPENQLPANVPKTINAEIADELPIKNFVLPKRDYDLSHDKTFSPEVVLIDQHEIITQYPFFLNKFKMAVDINLHVYKEDLSEISKMEVENPNPNIVIFGLINESNIPWKDTPKNRLSLLKKHNLQPLNIPEICTFAKDFFNPYPLLCYGSEKNLGSTAREIVITRNRGFSSFFKPRNTIHGVSFGCSNLYKPVYSTGKGIMYMAKEIRRKNRS
jgi:hypothetical protein